MATPVDVQTVVAIVTVAASAGAAWAGVKVGLNGMRETVKTISATLSAHVEADHRIQVEAAAIAARIEEKCEGIRDRVEDLRDQVKDLADR